MIFLFLSFTVPIALGLFAIGGPKWPTMGPWNMGAGNYKLVAVLSILSMGLLFFLGILLVIASVAGVWFVVAASRQTAPAFAANRTIVPGEAIGRVAAERIAFADAEPVALAAARFAQQHHEFAGTDRQIQVPHHGHVAEALDHALQFESAHDALALAPAVGARR